MRWFKHDPHRFKQIHNSIEYNNIEECFMFGSLTETTNENTHATNQIREVLLRVNANVY